MSSLWSSIKTLYSLDTLDTRFTNSSKAPVTRAAQEHGQVRDNGDVKARARPSKWNTTEYYFYYLVFLTAVPMMFWVPYSVSRESDSQYPRFAHLLSDGWVPGRKVDNSDLQYANFRNNIPYLAILVVVHPLLRRAYNSFAAGNTARLSKNPDAQAEQRLHQRVSFDLVFGVIMVIALHGFSAAKVFLILYINYNIATILPRRYVPAATWVFNIGILFANETFEGYRWSRIAETLKPPSTPADRINWGTVLDKYGGLVPRWEVLFNITVLRLISFNMDYYWSLNQTNDAEKRKIDPAAMSERDRVAVSHPLATYSFSNYLSYAIYSPLYLAGPILSFNDYISQLRYPPPSITTKRTIMYGIRFVVILLTMELVLHFIYAVAISKSNPDWSHYTPFQLSMLGYFNLHIIWLKLLIPWRFFRLWSLLDGIDPPENMLRCMSNNYSTVTFWRAWHRSFNRWLVRYIFIPLGGSGKVGQLRSILNMLVVFTFVALWHDISATLLTWSWLIILFLLPEVVCSTLLFPARKYRHDPERYRFISGVGAVGNVLMMMVANLVGFAIGVDGIKGLVENLVSGWHGLFFVAAACATLFVGVQVMFEVREEEKRQGIDLKC